MERKFCQSCGMPLTEEVLGTNADGSKNEEYCMYCYKDGKFLQECTMDEMIKHCAQFVGEVNKGLPQGQHLFLRRGRLQRHDAAWHDGGADRCRLEGDNLA